MPPKPIAILLMVLIACFVLGGIIVIIASDRGQEVARVQVPDGSSVVVAGDKQSTIRKLELRVAALENERIAATGDKPAAPPCPKHSITVNLAADGSASVGDRPIPLADVAAFVGKDLRERGIPPTECAIVVQAPHGAPWPMVTKLMEDCNAIGIRSFSFHTAMKWPP